MKAKPQKVDLISTNYRFEIMFSDLTEEAQKRLLKFEGINTMGDANWDVFPISIIEREKN